MVWVDHRWKQSLLLARAGFVRNAKTFLEVHTDPDNVRDGPNMLRLEDFETVIDDIVKTNMNEKFSNACDRVEQNCPADDASAGRYPKVIWK